MVDRLTAGRDISDSKRHVCSTCKADVLLGRVRDQTGTLRWRNFERKPIERGPHNYYRRHFCPR